MSDPSGQTASTSARPAGPLVVDLDHLTGICEAGLVFTPGQARALVEEVRALRSVVDRCHGSAHVVATALGLGDWPCADSPGDGVRCGECLMCAVDFALQHANAIEGLTRG